MKALLLCAALLLVFSNVPAQHPSVHAFTNVHVLTMEGEEVLRNHTVIVRGDRIDLIGPYNETEIPTGAEVIAGDGRYLMPGLAEMHGHIPSPQAAAEYTENVMFLYVAGGVTTVRGMLGWPNQLELRDRVNRREMVGPNLYLAGPSFSGGSINSPEEARERVRQQVEEGWDLLKVHPGLTREEYDAMAETANELGIRFGGHVPADVGLIHAIEMGQETFDHIDGYVEYLNGAEGPVDEAELQHVVQLSREADVWIVPTMALWEVLFGYADLDELMQLDEIRYAPSDMVESWRNAFQNRINHENFNPEVSRNVIENRMRILKALSDGGVRILMGTDAPQQFSVPGLSLPRELRLMEEAGMSRYDILRSGTTAVGEYFREQDTFGNVAEGHRADLLLLDANPLEDLSPLGRPAGVMVSGKWFSRVDLDRRLNEIEAEYGGGD